MKHSDEALDTRRPVMTADFENLIDIVENSAGEPMFLLREGDGLDAKHEIELDGKICIPPPKTQIPWLLPRLEKVLEYWQGSLSKPVEWHKRQYMELLEFHKRVSEMPSPEYYDLLVAWDFHTHLMEKFQFSPIICLYAVAERGKTRTGKAMTYLARHGVVVECLREAYIIRIARDLKAMIFFDVKNIADKAIKNNSEDILLGRFETGMKVPRVVNPRLGPHQDIAYYSAFGATIIGTNTSLDHILETRAVMINMRETSERFENNVTEESCLEFREKLLVFRARFIGSRLLDTPKPASGRLGDILKPLLQIIELVCPERKAVFLKLTEELRQGRQIEKLDSLEAQILRTVVSLSDQVSQGLLPVKMITDIFNRERAERYFINYHRMGHILSSMGFKKHKTGEGNSAIIWDQKSIEKMKVSYGLKTSPEIPASPTPSPGNSGVSGDDSDVYF